MKRCFSVFLLTFALAFGIEARADNYDCYNCWHHGGWTPGEIHWTSCHKSMNGEGAGCYVRNDECEYNGGCVSLPDDAMGLPI